MIGRMAVAAVLLCAGAQMGAAAEKGCSSAACINMVFDGDSISAGVGATRDNTPDRLVARALGHVRVYNVAVSGRPVGECVRLFPDLVARLFVPGGEPNVIVFHAGDNDIALGNTAAGTYAAFTSYVAAAHAQGWKVVASTELRRFDFPAAKEAQLEAYNDRLRENKAHADAVVDLDAEPKFTDVVYRGDPAVFSKDRIHLSDGGYAVLAELLTPAVKRVAGREPIATQTAR
nr:SGNH/GDSL hydrolase family protein [uncultured Rhodopila sp.]